MDWFKRQSTAVKGGIGCLGLFLLCGMCSMVGLMLPGSTGTSTTTTAPVTTGSAPERPAEVAAPAATVAQAYKIGDEINLPPMGWMVESAETLGDRLVSDNQFVEDKVTSGKWLRVSVVVANGGKDEEMLIGGPQILDSQGREFDSSSDAFMFVPTEANCALESINPGLAKPCVWIFELPADAVGLKLRVYDNAPFGGETALVDLGQ